MGRRLRMAAVGVALAVAVSGCKLKNQEPPPLAGPSELALSLAVTAVPDVLTQDGASQAQIQVQARDANGQPLRNVPLRAEIQILGVVQDFGSLSARTIVTGNDGQASFVYTAPLAAVPAVDTNTVVTIAVTPIGNDFGNALPRYVQIRLVPPGIILPPNGTPVPAFTFSPASPTLNQAVNFDASTSKDPDGTIVSYSWNFGDGSTGSGMTTQHRFSQTGSFSVVLTVTDDRGLSASTTPFAIIVGPGTAPTASFTFSPSAPARNQAVFFNGTASRAAPGHSIVSYTWQFGDGGAAGGITASHVYALVGSYNVTLTVRDDQGLTDTSTQTLAVTESGPSAIVASFTFSPLSPAASTLIFFDASASLSAAGITSYEWDFGDGAQASGVTTSHAYTVAATYIVRLTVRDSIGRVATTTQNITVTATGAGAPVASFTFSPTNPSSGTIVFFNATASTGQNLTYAWDFGDGTGGTGATTNHTYLTAPAATRTFVVRLTVTDSAGRTATTTQNVPVTFP